MFFRSVAGLYMLSSRLSAPGCIVGVPETEWKLEAYHMNHTLLVVFTLLWEIRDSTLGRSESFWMQLLKDLSQAASRQSPARRLRAPYIFTTRLCLE